MNVFSRAAARLFLVVGLLAVACVLVSLSSAQAPADGSPFAVEQSSLELGKMVAGQTVTATFVFHNDGPEDVHIIRAKPS